MFLQTMETANASFLGSSLIFWLLWLGAFLLAYALYWFGYGSRYRDQLEDKESLIKKLRPQLNVLSNEKEHLSTEKTTLKTNLEELVTKYNTLKAYHDSSQAKHQASIQQFEQANEERQSLLDSYESLEKNLEATEQRYNESLAKIDALEIELESMEEGVPVAALANNTLPLEQEINQLKGIIKNKEAEINQLNTSLAAKPKKQIKIIENPEKFQELEQKFTVISGENERLQNAYSALQNDYNHLRNEHTTLTNNFQEIEAKSQQQNVVALDVLETNQLQLKLKAAGVKYAKLLQLKEQLTLQLTQKEKTVKELSTLNNQLTDKFELVTTQHQKALAHVDSLQGSIYSSEKVQAEKRGAVNQMERLLKEAKMETDLLKEKNIELTISQKQLNESYTSVKNELASLQPKIAEIQKLKSGYIGDSQQLKSTIKSQGEELLKAQARLKAYSELKSVNLALDNNNKNLNTAYSNLQKKYDSFHKDYLTMKSQFQLLRDKYEHLENTSSHVKESKFKVERTNSKLSTEIAELRKTTKDLQANKSGLEKRLKEMEKHLTTPQKKSTSSIQTTRRYKNGTTTKSIPPDDLKIIEGIGGKMEVLLNNAGIFTWKQLSRTGIGELKRMLAAGGTQLNLHDPSTWPEQAQLAEADKWEQLEQFQKELNGGRR